MAIYAAEAVLGLVATMRPVGEVGHLKGLRDIVDFRGSDIRLDTGAILDRASQYRIQQFAGIGPVFRLMFGSSRST